MNINLPNFNVKNLIKEAGHSLSRAVQLTEEKLGTTERTEYDQEFQTLAENADASRMWTEKIVKDTESVLVPNPQNRVEDFIFEKIDKSKPQRLSNLEHLAMDMIEAGGEFGQDLLYGQALIKVGQAEQKLGRCERDFIGSATVCFTHPLRAFLEGEMKIVTKDRGLLESKRLDLDACKSRVKKARSMLGQPTKDGLSPETALEQAERDLRVAQSEFDRQSDITKSLLQGLNSSHSDHLKHLYAFVQTQLCYYKKCNEVMNQLQRELIDLGVSEDIDLRDVDNEIQSLNCETYVKHVQQNQNPKTSSEMKRARVLCSYDAKDHTELTLITNEVIFVSECSPPHTDYMYGKQGLLQGLVPRAFLEMLDEGES
uniref:Uncharacterized protein n=1 Tax=Glossina brevipalpis TaxID=37001 RepID=A0A1A9WW16_9MUSC